MVEAVGNRVVALRRVGFGSLALGRLAEGGARRLVRGGDRPALERCGAVRTTARYEEPRQRLFAVRGAAQAEANEAEAILAATEELMRELIERNGLEPEAMVSCLFTTTDDLDAEFPAVAARSLGLDAVPLLCCREIPVPGSMPRVIRVMLHFYAPAGPRPAHAYIGEAQKLRADLEAAQ